GHLTGLIGEQGAVGAFVSGTGTKDVIVKGFAFAGGFVASPNVADRVDYIDWTGSFTTTLTDTMLATGTRVSQFLAAATALDETGAGTINATRNIGRRGIGDVTIVNKGSLNLKTATFKGTAFNGQAADGVSWFLDSENNFGYAGILAGTDLGVPLTQTSGTAIWQGHIQASGSVGIFSSDFILNINFDNNGKKTIDAFVFRDIKNIDTIYTMFAGPASTNYYHLTGEFDDKGVITGKVNYGTFSDLTARTTDREPNGILTGLIGSQGAVGAFISGTGDKNAIAKVDSVYYAGGFVAKPTAPLDDNVVNYDDWARSFAALPPTRVYQTGQSTHTSQFLGTVPTATELSRVGVLQVWFNGGRGRIDLAASLPEVTFAGDAADGVSWTWDADGGNGHAGVLASTNLGAPLAQTSGTANWNGHILALTTAISREFVLEIDFDNSGKKTIEAFVQRAGEDHFHITGEFDDKGVITGKVDYGRFNAGTRTQKTARDPNGILTGLIGMEGAVGAFVSGTGTKDAIARHASARYSGGFVASSTATSIGVNVKFNDWVRTVGPSDAINTTFQNQFLRGTPDNIPA
ncbi:MAG: hypothetical protein K8953_09310, partial [Proteobacteria bacterium]|nr:hypothetical protein [Pseudomonadota bacterium]